MLPSILWSVFSCVKHLVTIVFAHDFMDHGAAQVHFLCHDI